MEKIEESYLSTFIESSYSLEGWVRSLEIRESGIHAFVVISKERKKKIRLKKFIIRLSKSNLNIWKNV